LTEKELYCEISGDVFARFPDYSRGVVCAYSVKNGDSPEELVSMLREAEASLRERIATDGLVSDPRIAAWREAYRSIGAKPSKYRPSMEAMARRVLKGGELPSINALVDIGNVVSLRRLLPAGGHAIDVLTEDMALRPAAGDEEFVPFGSDKVEHPAAGEIILVEGKTVLTRRWTWRQANHTLLLPTTTDLEFNVDGLPPVEIPEVEEACGEIAELIERFCGGSFRIQVITRDNPKIRLDRAA
jgi:DNA/RNA-binding domain of Phe-tRNA-synthetase-like protein